MQVGRSGWPIGTKTKPLFLDMVSSQAMVSLSFVSYSLIFFGNESFSYKFYKSSPIFVSIPSISYFKVFNIKLSRGKTIIQLGFAQNKIVKFSKHFSSIYYFVSKRIYIQVSYEGFRGCFSLFSYIILDPCISYVLIQMRHFLSKVWMICVRQQKIIIYTVNKIVH